MQFYRQTRTGVDKATLQEIIKKGQDAVGDFQDYAGMAAGMLKSLGKRKGGPWTLLCCTSAHHLPMYGFLQVHECLPGQSRLMARRRKAVPRRASLRRTSEMAHVTAAEEPAEHQGWVGLCRVF